MIAVPDGTADAAGAASPERAGGDRGDAARLADAGSALGLDLPTAAVHRLVVYLDLLQRWNRVYNLTSVRERDAMRIQHLNDSLAILAAVRRRVSVAPRLLDVGSGAGLPGVVVATCWPEARVTCIDAVGKKAAFVQQVAAELQLPNLEAVHGRIESFDVGAGHDVVTARAFATLATTAEVTRRCLDAGGVWCLAKGRRPDVELAELPGDIAVFHVEQLTVPELVGERHLVWMRSQTDSSAQRTLTS